MFLAFTTFFTVSQNLVMYLSHIISFLIDEAIKGMDH